MPLSLLTRRFRPSWAMTLAVIPALGVLLALGTWQIERMHWKQGLIAERAARMTAPPAALPASIPLAAQFEFRRVQATGRFLYDRELYLGNRPYRSQPGYHVITPLQRADGSAVLVDRGWVPIDRKLPDSRGETNPAGQVTVHGIARLSAEPGLFTPANQVDGNFWFYVDIPAMARAARLNSVLPVYIEAGQQADPRAIPIGGRTDTSLSNNHFQYAMTWYALAVALAVIFVLRSMKAE